MPGTKSNQTWFRIEFNMWMRRMGWSRQPLTPNHESLIRKLWGLVGGDGARAANSRLESRIYIYIYRTCPVQTFGRVRTDLGRAAKRDFHTLEPLIPMPLKIQCDTQGLIALSEGTVRERQTLVWACMGLAVLPQPSTLNTQHSTLNTQHSTLNTQHSTLNTQHSLHPHF